MELANAFEPIQEGRIYVEVLNGPFLRARWPSTRQSLIWPSPRLGLSCTKAARSSDSRNPARTCSH